MGEVWEADQLAPVRRTVALKLLKAGMDTRQIVARFEAERQVLALMQHPGIAQMFDAGVTSGGRSYLVSVMMDSTPRWWVQLKAWAAAIDYRTAEIKQRRILRKLLDDAHPATPSYFLQDEAFYEGQPSPHYPVAKK